jgi:hypothetical protein
MHLEPHIFIFKYFEIIFDDLLMARRATREPLHTSGAHVIC